MKGKTVLITGAAGFVGSHVARFCSELEMDVVGFDDFSLGTANVPFLGDIRILKGDLTNATALRALFAKYRFDVVYHLEDQSTTMALSHHAPSQTYTRTVVGMANLVTEAVKANVSRIVMLSSTAVYGTAPGPWAESAVAQPVDPYGISKLAAEQHLQSAGAYFGIKHTILRAHGLYGPRMPLDPVKSSVVARAIGAAYSGTPLQITSEGKQKRQFTLIEDIVPHVVAAAFLQRDGLVINLGADEVTSVADVVSHVASALNRPVATAEAAYEGGVHHVQAVHDLSRCTFAIAQFTSFKDGLQKTIAWAQESKADLAAPAAEVRLEITDRLPATWMHLSETVQSASTQQSPRGKGAA